MLDLIVKGGRVVTPDGVAEMDVAVQGERIAALAPLQKMLDLSPPAENVKRPIQNAA